MRIREDLLQRARSQSVISYLQHLGIKGRYSNGRWVCCSPLRKESEASFSVSPEKNLWHDFGLGVGGDLISSCPAAQTFHKGNSNSRTSRQRTGTNRKENRGEVFQIHGIALLRRNSCFPLVIQGIQLHRVSC